MRGVGRASIHETGCRGGGGGLGKICIHKAECIGGGGSGFVYMM